MEVSVHDEVCQSSINNARFNFALICTRGQSTQMLPASLRRRATEGAAGRSRGVGLSTGWEVKLPSITVSQLGSVGPGVDPCSGRSRVIVPKRKRWCGGRRRVVVTPVWLAGSFVFVIRPSGEFDFVDCRWYGFELFGFEFIMPGGFERVVLVYLARVLL